MTKSISAGDETSAGDTSDGVGESVAPRPYVLTDAPGPLNHAELTAIDAKWRAANYLAVGQIYLRSNPLLRDALRPEHIKPRLLGHFGTVPGLNLVWAHVNRAILTRDLNAVFVAGPGHGGPGPNACAWLEGTYSELYSHVSQDIDGMAALFANRSPGMRVPVVVVRVIALRSSWAPIGRGGQQAKLTATCGSYTGPVRRSRSHLPDRSPQTHRHPTTCLVGLGRSPAGCQWRRPGGGASGH